MGYPPPGQDPYGQQPSQDPYGQPQYGQPQQQPYQDPYAQPQQPQQQPYQDPYAQPQQPAYQDPYAQQPPVSGQPYPTSGGAYPTSGGAYPQAGYGTPGYGAPAQQQNTLGLVGMILGIAAIPLVCCFYIGIPMGIGAAVVSYLGMNKVKQGLANNRGMALAGLICGSIAAGLGIILIILAVAFNLNASYT